MRPYSSLSLQNFGRNQSPTFPFVLGNGSKKVIMEHISHVHIADYEEFKQIERYKLIRSPLQGLLRKGNTFERVEQY